MNKYITPLTANEVLAWQKDRLNAAEQIYPGISAANPRELWPFCSTLLGGFWEHLFTPGHLYCQGQGDWSFF